MHIVGSKIDHIKPKCVTSSCDGIVKIGACPIKQWYEVVANRFDVCGREAAHGLDPCSNLCRCSTATQFDRVRHPYGFADVPSQTGLFDNGFRGVDVFCHPRLASPVGMQGSHDTCRTCLPDLG